MNAPRERAVIAEQIGRDPRGDVEIVARCEYGLPAVVRTPPLLEGRTPFPTLYYLVCPMAIRAVGRLEAAGTMRVYEERLASDPDLREEYARAHDRYLAERDAIAPLADRSTAGGMPGRVKCLHALYAHELADANPVGALVRDAVEPLGCPGPCVSDDENGSPRRVAGHPGFGRKRRH